MEGFPAVADAFKLAFRLRFLDVLNIELLSKCCLLKFISSSSLAGVLALEVPTELSFWPSPLLFSFDPDEES